MKIFATRLLFVSISPVFQFHEIFFLFFFSDYLLSNNHVNSIIVHKFDFSDEEVMAYYISFLKTLSFRLNKHTIHFFYNEVSFYFLKYKEIKKWNNWRDFFKYNCQSKLHWGELEKSTIIYCSDYFFMLEFIKIVVFASLVVLPLYLFLCKIVCL